MPRIAYETCVLKDAGLQVALQANDICTAYARDGYDLTLRQLYYQFVSRGLLANRQQNCPGCEKAEARAVAEIAAQVFDTKSKPVVD